MRTLFETHKRFTPLKQQLGLLAEASPLLLRDASAPWLAGQGFRQTALYRFGSLRYWQQGGEARVENPDGRGP